MLCDGSLDLRLRHRPRDERRTLAVRERIDGREPDPGRGGSLGGKRRRLEKNCHCENSESTEEGSGEQILLERHDFSEERKTNRKNSGPRLRARSNR